ncbi:alpha/beta hydrolase fold family protein [Burkholderia multivorans]|uniref:Alpha/beta hydrolase fold family protein n=1 Tax=Burkholderia multivorans TaxID=87883 RepID=A0ABD7LHY6_9BURK|nr:prolyl oligopeptidase family serine peptidase [Burkholderia multivorans]SAK15332.1 alpha/beta hydrolase fold family protein [Burkholderia multivorans]
MRASPSVATLRPLEIDDVLRYESFEGYYVPIVDISPDKKRVAITVTSGLAGRTHTARFFLWSMDRGCLHIVDLTTGEVRAIQGPQGAGISAPLWSPDGTRVAAVAASQDWLRLCVVGADSGEVTIVSERDILIEPGGSHGFQWVDNVTIACRCLPAGQHAQGIRISNCTTERAPAAWAAMQSGKVTTANVFGFKDSNNPKTPHQLALVSLSPLHVSYFTEAEPKPPALATFASLEAAAIDAASVGAATRASERCLWHDDKNGDRLTISRSNHGTVLKFQSNRALPRDLLRLNTHLSDVGFGEAFDLQYTLSNGRPTSMSCVLPPNHSEDEKRPSIMFVYPGFDRAYNIDESHLLEGPHFIYNKHLFAAQGYTVIEPNLPFDPDADIPFIDSLVDGVSSALHAAESAGIIDSDSVHVLGQSAGGWAVMALLARTRYFRSGVSLAGIADLIALHGQVDPRLRYEDADQADFTNGDMCEHFFHIRRPPWEDAAPYLHNSPLFLADKFSAPLLLMHGDLDYISIAQSEAMFLALTRLKKPVEFVRYLGEDHVYASAPNIRDAFTRIVEWFRRHSAV